MSNLDKNLHCKPPVQIYQEKQQQSQKQDYDFENSLHDAKTENSFKSNTANFVRGNGVIKTEIHEKPFYCKQQSESDNISVPQSNTILITTHNYSSQIPKTAAKHLTGNKSSSSSITIVTTHNSNGNLSSTTNNGTTSIQSSNGECITGSYNKSLNGNSSTNSPVLLEGINILINNHFNEPSSSVSEKKMNDFESCDTSLHTPNIISINSNSIDNMDQKNIDSTSETFKEIETKKSEKSDIQTEPDSTTNGLSPDKSLTLKTSNSNSDTGFGSSSSFCSSNSSNSSSISSESTNNIKKQKIYNFSVSMDVLVQKKDGKFYLGVIKNVYAVDGKCLISFDDSSEYLADFEDLKQLSLDSEVDSSPMCVVCKKTNSNDIVESCEKCARGYHRFCVEGGYKNGIWTCKMCSTQNGVKTSEKKLLSSSLKQTSKDIKKFEFSYDIQNLTWDNKHRMNNEQMYCYCGKQGKWDKKMLQCLKCLQWFHEKCIQDLTHPLLEGDRYYVFICSVCNNGHEMIRRLKFSWVDLVHLILFNLTKLGNGKKYHHVTKVITPFAIQNWSNLQLSVSMNSLSQKQIHKKIVDVLNDSSRFKCGKETMKGLVYWGLRSCVPPAVPKILIPRGTTKITDQFLKSVLKLKFLSPPINSKKITLESEEEPFLDDNDSKLSSDLKFSSEDEIPIKNIIQKEQSLMKKEYVETKNIEEINLESVRQKKEQCLLQKQQKELSRRKKKHTFYPRLPNLLTSDKSIASNAANLNNNVNISNNNFNEKSVGSTADMFLCCDSSDDNSSLGPLDLRIPPPKNFFGRNNPFRQTTPKKNQDQMNRFHGNKKNFPTIATLNISSHSVNYKKNLNNGNKSIDLSSKLVALKKSSVNLFNGGLSKDIQTAGQFRIIRTIKRRLSAKDLVIGPNQEIKKRRLRRSSGSGNVEVISTSIQSYSSSKSKSNIIATYPIGSSFKFESIAGLTSTPVQNNTCFAATSSTVSVNSAAVAGSTNSNNLLDISPTSVDSNNTFTNFACITAAQKLRNLRKRDDKNYAENRRNSSSSTSNIALNSNTITGNSSNIYNGISSNCISAVGESNKNNSYEQSVEDDLSDLQSSVNMYFGAVQRIRNGEKFIVRGKRTLSNGKTQFLMEWEGCAQAGH